MSGNDFLPALLFFDPNNAPEMLKQFPQATLMRLNRTVQAVLSRGTSLPPAVADDEPAWNSFYSSCWGDLPILTLMLKEAHLNVPLIEYQGGELWRDRMIHKTAAEFETSQNPQKIEQMKAHGISVFEASLKCLGQCQENPTKEIIEKAIVGFIEVLSLDAMHSQCYFNIAFCLHLLHLAEEAMALLEIGHSLDPSNVLYTEMKSTLMEPAMDSLFLKENAKTPLLVGQHLAGEVREFLTQAFNQYDTDKDGKWSPQEVVNYASFINNAPCPPEFATWMCSNFESSNGFLELGGFLDFIRMQTYKYPEETMEDLRKLGFNMTAEADDKMNNEDDDDDEIGRHTSELQSHSFISYAVFCLKKKKNEAIDTYTQSVTRCTRES
eukprot:TRINITY_DN3456_c0_g1_i1.p1 TRINITY_DN3456_c0_g1~~TRINITY_DN3456_c0_g1_i1.p1  ORF type:complete len:381 (-),score=73.23 TRINITY_DN3456_c0_g1_i1:8-1150(-)